MDKGSFPFDISDVAMLLNLNIRSKRNQRMDVDCPICGDKRGKTTIYLDANVFRCHHCGEGGGMIILYAKTYGISNSDAYREICDTLSSCRSAPNYTVRKKEIYSAHGSTRNSEPAALNVRHQTYSMLFSSLTLSKTHKQHLISRGLTTEQIEHYGFKSTPAFGCANIVRTLLRQGSVLHGVPGFYTDELGEWSVKFSAKCTGIIIPVTTINGCIAGAQIRLDNPSKGCKYIWFSSVNEKDGASSGSPIGFAGDPAAETVYITEGYVRPDRV